VVVFGRGKSVVLNKLFRDKFPLGGEKNVSYSSKSLFGNWWCGAAQICVCLTLGTNRRKKVLLLSKREVGESHRIVLRNLTDLPRRAYVGMALNWGSSG